MSWHIVLLVLVAYPVLYLLPLNLIRFRWGLERGLEPMPPEMEDKAEVADRTARFVGHVMLFALVALSMRGSSIPFQEFGFSLNNWKSAVGMGLMFSLLPVVFAELFLSKVPPETARKEGESRGPVAAWCGLMFSGSFSNEIWRAFCIIVLMRYGFPAWLAVLLPAFFAASVSLQFSIATAFGTAVMGVVVGFLFVQTGSLLATGSMTFISGLAHLHSVRQACAGPRPTSQRFFRPCPVCGEVIHLSKIRWAGDMLTCPNCGECLTTKKKYLWAIGAVSVGVAGYAMRRFIYGDPGYFLIAEALALVLFFVLAVGFSFVVPPKLKRVQGKGFDKGLSLFGTNQPNGNKKDPDK